MKKDVQWNICRVFMLNIRTFIPERFLCRCCKPSLAQRKSAMTFMRLRKEVSIDRIIKQLRVLKALVRKN